MEKIDLVYFENILEQKIFSMAEGEDPAHDLLHVKRVVNAAKKLCNEESANQFIVVPAAWLHDFIVIPKNDPRRKIASRLSADAAKIYLKEIGYPIQYFEAIAHAIEAHSYSANIPTESIEAKIVQDADRLDGLGAIGIARCFATAGLLNRPFYSETDPFCDQRSPDDSIYTVDHFYKKLFKTAETLQTKSGKVEGQRRLQVMRSYLEHLQTELDSTK